MLAKRHTVNISRKVDLGTNGRRQNAVVAEGVKCLLIPMSTNTAIQNDFTPSKGWEGFFDYQLDVREGDKLTAFGKTFMVRFIRPFTGVGRASHLHAMCEEVDS